MLNKDRLRKPDKLDIVLIRNKAAQKIVVNGQVTLGKAIFTEACNMFPDAVKPLIATEFDCYYDDSRIDLFLSKIQE